MSKIFQATLHALPLLLLPSLLACAGSLAPPPARTAAAPEPAAAAVKAAADASADTAALRVRLQEVADGAAWSELRLFAECRQDTGQLLSVEIFGNGVGFWDDRRQFSTGESEIRSLLARLAAADFAGFDPVYGGRPKLPPKPDDPGGSSLQVICRVRLALDGHAWEVAQLAKGKQSQEFLAMAGDLLAAAEPLAAAGVEAADLADGLDKVASGQLAPEALRLVLHRRPDLEAGGGRGFLLRIEAGLATSREFESDAGFGPVRALSLDPAETAALASTVAASRPAELPPNLYAAAYTDFSIELLNHRASVQARQFAGLSPETHGERQQRFDRLYASLERLHQRVLGEGELQVADPA